MPAAATETSDERDARKDPEGTASKLARWESESESNLSLYHQRWAKNIQLLRGIWNEEELSRSEVRGRSKLYFRKIWATNWRLYAALYAAFMRDQDTFRIEGRGAEDVYDQEQVLQFMCEYRRDYMMSCNSLFMQMMWGVMDIFDLGMCAGKLWWSKTANYDGPKLKMYAPEDARPDMSATLPEDMQYFLFINHMTMDELKENKFKNVELLETQNPKSNSVRHSRHIGVTDPNQDPGTNEYPTVGKYDDGTKESVGHKKYRVIEGFWRNDGKIYYGVACNGIVLKEKALSKYGNKHMPVLLGLCLTIPHRLIGEGMPEPLEGPQESINDTINTRKDNVHIFLNRGTIVSRFAGVDLESLVNVRPGAMTLADDVEGVKERQMGDVTQSSYMEVNGDETMMEEMSGVTDVKRGMDKSNKTGVAQINLSESNAKMDLFIAIIGNTLFRSFYYQLAQLIQKFESDDTVYRVANKRYRDKLRREKLPAPMHDIYEVDNFDADARIEIGPGTVGRQIEIQQIMAMMDKAVMSNQSMAQLVTAGIRPPQGMRFFDTTKFMERVLPKMNIRNPDEFFVDISQGQLPMGDGGGSGPSTPLEGAGAPAQTGLGGMLG